MIPSITLRSPRVACAIVGLSLLAAACLAGCSDSEAVIKKRLVGKWQSSRLSTPLYLYENSDWEIRKNDGTVLQYGVWNYKDKKILWSYKSGSEIGHDVNPVVAVGPRQFEVRERDQSLTTFQRLD